MSDNNNTDIKWPTVGYDMCCGRNAGHAGVDHLLPVKWKGRKYESGCNVVVGEGALL